MALNTFCRSSPVATEHHRGPDRGQLISVRRLHRPSPIIDRTGSSGQPRKCGAWYSRATLIHPGRTCRSANPEPTIRHMSPLQALRAAADGLAHHPHDHGWRSLYDLFRYGLHNSAPELTRSLIDAYRVRPLSATHLLTLLGIALKAKAQENFAYLASQQPFPERLIALEDVLRQHSSHITNILLSRQNSFTCARRFLVTRVLLSAYFTQHHNEGISFADLGALFKSN